MSISDQYISNIKSVEQNLFEISVNKETISGYKTTQAGQGIISSLHESNNSKFYSQRILDLTKKNADMLGSINKIKPSLEKELTEVLNKIKTMIGIYFYSDTKLLSDQILTKIGVDSSSYKALIQQKNAIVATLNKIKEV
jgi:hypothetical protein